MHDRRVERFIQRKIAAITPYGPCYGGKWAIPCRYIGRESGGSWTAHNPTSPARGPYQLLNHGEPWPVLTLRDRLLHHRIARKLWGQQLAHTACPWCYG